MDWLPMTLVIHDNCGPILFRFQDKRRWSQSKNAKFSYPIFIVLVEGVTLGIL